MGYEDAVEYILKKCNGLDLSSMSKDHIIEEMKPKENAAD